MWYRNWINSKIRLLTDNPDLDFDHYTGQFIVQSTVRVHILIGGVWQEFIARQGLRSDGSSHPWIARLIVKFLKVFFAALFHDDIYKYGELPDGTKISKTTADYVYWLLGQYGEENRANVFQMTIMFIGVWIGGWVPWLKYRWNEGGWGALRL